MSTNKNSLKQGLQNLSDYERLFDLIYRYSKAAMAREIAHSMNNSLTVLSMQRDILEGALRKEHSTNALKRAEDMREAINNLCELSENLVKSTELPRLQENVSVNEIVEETLTYAQLFPYLSKCLISLRLTDEPSVYEVDSHSIKMLLLSFVQKSGRVYSKPLISISTTSDKKSGGFFIYANAQDQETPGLAELEGDIPRTVGSRPGEIPLRKMKWLIESINSNVQLSLTEEDNIGFTCFIAPTGFST